MTHAIVPPYLLARIAAAQEPALAARGRGRSRHARRRPRVPAGALAAAAVDRGRRHARRRDDPRSRPGDLRRHRAASRCPERACAARTTPRPATPPSMRPSTGWARRSTSSGTRSAATASTARAGPCYATVHYGDDYDNAFWNGERMVFGDGDGEIFTGFTGSLSVIAPRAQPRRHRGRGRARLPRAVRRAQRVDRGRLRRPRRAAPPRADRRRGQLADRRGDLHGCRRGPGAALPGRAGHGVRRRRARTRPAARAHGRLRRDPRRQRRRAHQFRHPEPRVLPAPPWPSAATPGSEQGSSGTARSPPARCRRRRTSQPSRTPPSRRPRRSTVKDSEEVDAVRAGWTGVGVLEDGPDKPDAPEGGRAARRRRRR